MGGTSCERFLQLRVETQMRDDIDQHEMESHQYFKSKVEGECNGTFT